MWPRPTSRRNWKLFAPWMKSWRRVKNLELFVKFSNLLYWSMYWYVILKHLSIKRIVIICKKTKYNSLSLFSKKVLICNDSHLPRSISKSKRLLLKSSIKLVGSHAAPPTSRIASSMANMVKTQRHGRDTVHRVSVAIHNTRTHQPHPPLRHHQETFW